MSKSLRDEVVKFLVKYQQSFTWCTEDMLGIDTIIVEHKVNINPTYPPVKQNLDNSENISNKE